MSVGDSGTELTYGLGAVFNVTRNFGIRAEWENVDDAEPVAGRGEGLVEDVRPGTHLSYRLSPLLPDGGPAFTAHVGIDIHPTGTGTDLDVHYRVTDSTVGSADFIAGIELGFGQSLDKLVATLAADSHGPRNTENAMDTRSTE